MSVLEGVGDRLRRVADAQRRPLVFATVSGSHLYGFPSADSDHDLRGVHLLPLDELIGLDPGPDTISIAERSDEGGLELVSHDLRKFARLLLRPNGYVLEQLLSPLVVSSSALHEELVALAPGCVTRHHAAHYLGAAANQRALLGAEDPPRLKPLLSEFRVLMTGIHLLRSACIETDLRLLNAEFQIPYLPELIEQKRPKEQSAVADDHDLARYEADCDHLRRELAEAAVVTDLPDAPTARRQLADLVVRART